MNMNAHLEHLQKKAMQGIAILKYAAGQNVTQASLFKLMTATVCSRSNYGLHLTQCASKKAVMNLQRVENQTMRIVTGAARATSCSALQYWLDLASIRERQKTQGVKEFFRIFNTPTHPLHQEIVRREDELVNQRLATVQSWIACSRSAIDSICPVENILSDEWMEYFRDDFTTEVLGSRRWRELAGDANNAIDRKSVV